MKALLLSCVATATMFSASALAHTHLVRSNPADQAVLEKSPAVATLVFAEAVTLTAVKIESTGGIKITPKPLPAGPAAELSVALPVLNPGSYTMRWRALSDDGHVMAGAVHFSVGGKGGH